MEKWIILIVLVTAFVFGISDETSDFSEEDPQQDVLDVMGEEAYVNNCASCHGGDLSGTAGPQLTGIGDIYTVEEIEQIIENGIGSMPPLSHLSDVERTEIAEWLILQ